MKGGINKMKKDNPSVIAYLQMLQDTITRMANNSGACKVLVLTVFTALSFNQSTPCAVKIAVIIYGCIADAYYLALERIYREKYNNFVDKLNKEQIEETNIYDMKPRNTNYDGEMFFKVLKSLTSFSIWSFYGTLVVIIFIVKGEM